MPERNIYEVYLVDSDLDGEVFDDIGTKLATRLCGSVFILTGDGETEGVRLRQTLPHLNFIYPQIRFKPQRDDPEYRTPYERDANRPAPFRMTMEQVTEEFRRFVAPYYADAEYSSPEFPPRLFWINEEVFMLLKMKF